MTKLAVITGGNQGIGRATLEYFENSGIKTYSLDQSIIDCPSNFIQCDVSKSSQVKEAVTSILNKEKQIDYLVCNAGLHLTGNIEQATEVDFDKIMNVNVKGAFLTIQNVIASMAKRQEGRIVIVGSDQSIVAKRHSCLYGMSKMALVSLTKSTALDYAEQGIHVNCVCPGTIDTPLYRSAMNRYQKFCGRPLEELEKEEAKLQPVGHIGKPEDVAELIYFLCTAKNDFMTGGLYPIDGGYTVG